MTDPTRLDTTLPADAPPALRAIFGEALARAGAPVAPAPLQPGDRLGAFTVLDTLGSGGMGEVLLVADEELGRRLAAKVVRPEATEPWILARFLVEARITGQLEHPGIVPVHAFGRADDGRLYMVMKRVDGRTLAEVLRDETTTLAQRLALLNRVCDAVAFAHSRGVIHRDLKPANVMVGAFGEVQVLDWGVARVLPDARVSVDLPEVAAAVGEPDPDALRTTAGSVIGTLMYMAPEQARGEPVDARADVYALGAILYEMLAGAPPFPTGDATRLRALVLAGDVEPPSRRGDREVPAELEAIAARAMATDPDARYPDVPALRDELQAYLDGRAVGAADYSRLARARKRLNRDPLTSAAVVVVVLCLTLVASGAVYTHSRATRQRRAAAQGRAQALEALGELERAQRELEHAVRLDGSTWSTHLQYGLLLRRRGDEDGARAALQRAQALAPEQLRPLIRRLRD